MTVAGQELPTSVITDSPDEFTLPHGIACVFADQDIMKMVRQTDWDTVETTLGCIATLGTYE